MTGAYGLGEYGLSSYGFGGPSFAFDYAFAVSERTVRVVLTAEPRFVSRIGTGDAKNPHLWSVTRDETSEPFTVMEITQVNSLTYDVFLLEKLPDRSITLTIESVDLFSSSGDPIAEPTSATFLGVVSKKTLTDALPLENQDLRNKDGALVVAAGSDFQNDSGLEFLNKKITRRLSTQQGAFYHLPDYGLGLPARVKTTFSVPQLVKLKSELERQILQEPEVRSVKVALTMDGQNGVLFVSYTGKTIFDARVQGEVAITLQSGG